jgi:microcystin-dependent protein
MAKFFKFPWATQGDKASPPDALQSDGSFSYFQGYGFDYERPNTDANYKPIDREGMNGLFHDITEAVGELQRQGAPSFTPDAAPYLDGSIVRHAGANWLSSADDNNTEPGLPGSKWANFGVGADVGDVKTVATESPPYGWLKCNGEEVSRTEYAALYAAIGTRFGTGDGTDTFNLPDLRGEFVRGWDDERGIDADRVLGTAQAGQNASHTHNATAATAGGHSHTGSTADAGSHLHSFSADTDTQGAHTHAMPRAINAEVGIGGPNITTANGADGATAQSFGAGDHHHSVVGATAPDGLHAHAMDLDPAPDHTHVITVQSSGATEGRPRNIALLYVIKY